MQKPLLLVIILSILLVTFSVPSPVVSAASSTETPTLIRDINTAQTEGSELGEFMPAGPVSYFFAKQSGNTWALWKTDGTSGGTTLVKQGLRPGGEDSALYNGYLYYAADDDSVGTELWRTNLVTDQTALFKDMESGVYSSDPHYMTVFEDRLYFAALWGRFQSSDGTPEGTPINDMWTEQMTSPMFIFHDSAYYAAFLDDFIGDNDRAYLAWFGSGGSGQTSDLTPGKPLTVFQDRLYFTAGNMENGQELWSTGGTLESIRQLRDINPGSGNANIDNAMEYNGLLYFIAEDAASGQRLWSTDGSEEETVPVFDPPLSSQQIQLVGVIQPESAEKPGGLLLVMETAPTTRQLFVYTKATTEPQLLANLGGFTNRVPALDSGTVFNNVYYFPAYDAEHGGELWRTDGTDTGTLQLGDIWSGTRGSLPAGFGPCGVRLCFSADDGVHGRELWSTDGTWAGTSLVDDLNTQPASAYPQGFVSAGNLLYFFARDAVGPYNLWRTNGTSNGSLALNLDPNVEILPGWQSGYQRFAAVGDSLFFAASDPGHGEELWVSDGSQTGTKRILDIWPGILPSLPDNLTAAGNRLFFTAVDPQVDRALWVTDGTPAGTQRIFTAPDEMDSAYWELIGYGEQVIFGLISENEAYCKVWRTDGTQDGTVMLLENVCLKQGALYDNKLYFSGTNTLGWTQSLWSTDGTILGTQPVILDLPDESVEAFEQMVPTQSGLYISARGFFEENGSMLYRITPSGIGSGPLILFYESLGMRIQEMAGFGQQLGLIVTHFLPGSQPSSYELWVSDGTPEGTRMVRDNLAAANHLTPVESQLFFSATESTDGNEQIWQSDGTKPVTDYPQQRCSSTPGQNSFLFHNGRFYLSLNDEWVNPPGNGCELWSINFWPYKLFFPQVEG
jgi:ELWxxDGT repeat protein